MTYNRLIIDVSNLYGLPCHQVYTNGHYVNSYFRSPIDGDTTTELDEIEKLSAKLFMISEMCVFVFQIFV